MESVCILLVAGLTSAGAYALGTARLRLPTSGLRPAFSKACECVGLMLVFSVVNLAVATSAVLVVRSLSGRFVSLYVAADAMFLMLSWLQALTFQAWREGAHRRHAPEPLGSNLLRREP
jgi:hypothetical protein